MVIYHLCSWRRVRKKNTNLYNLHNLYAYLCFAIECVCGLFILKVVFKIVTKKKLFGLEKKNNKSLYKFRRQGCGFVISICYGLL